MEKFYWEPIIDDKVHTVEVKWDNWSSRGEVLVDGKITDAWGWRYGGTIQFEVAGKPAILKKPLFSWNLIIDSQKVKQHFMGTGQKTTMLNKVLKIIGILAAFAVFPVMLWLIASSFEQRTWAIYAGIMMFIFAVFLIIKKPRGKE